MKLVCLLAAACLAVSPAPSAKQRDWKIGMLKETAHAVQPGCRLVPAQRSSIAAIRRWRPPPLMLPKLWLWLRPCPRCGKAFESRERANSFIVMCPIGRSRSLSSRSGSRSPNVTVNGPVKYAMDKGKFYLLDEDGKEWEMTVLEKALVPAPPRAPKKQD
jgi:hypothetical protein